MAPRIDDIPTSQTNGLSNGGPQVDMSSGVQVERPIVGFHQDDEGHWVALLECGHTRHVRHDPPWVSREWVLTEEGRSRFLGRLIECTSCSSDQAS